ncbi:MAG: hypothetical protein NXI04_20310 [Planctomycetaceae bacterium]|nr:hypothetical protein [Planctomycetaceae bacterium]
MIRFDRRKTGSSLRHGVVTVMVLVVLILLGGLLTQLVRRTVTEHRQSRRELHQRQAILLADAGVLRAETKRLQDPAYSGEVWTPDMTSVNSRNTAEVNISRDGDQWLVVASYPHNMEFPVRVTRKKGTAQ